MTDKDLMIQDLRRDNKQFNSQIDALHRQIHEYQKRLLAYEGVVPMKLAESAMYWRRVEDGLPHFNGEYIVCCDDSNEDSDMQIWGQRDVIAIGDFQDGLWAWEENGTEYDLTGLVTHWMPFPKPPEED